MALLQDNWSKHDNNFENTKFNDFSELGILDILTNIMSYNGFSKYSIYTVILRCHIDLFTYCLSKRSFIVKTKVVGIDNITMIVKHQINADNLHPEHRWELPGNCPYFEKYGNLPLCLENYALFSLPPIFTDILYTYP